jgi:NADPH:quinone reductase-like Zn-dependent oxidoreductase
MSTTTTKSPVNAAAYLTASKARPLEVGPAPYSFPNHGEVTVRNRAVAINPVDRLKQEKGNFLYSWLKYPAILGIDLAGEVVEVGKGVTRFKVGDRVLGFANGIDKARNKHAECAFQLYTVLPENLVSPIPDTMSFEQAAAIPLGAATAAAGLYEKDQLALPYPSLAPTPTSKFLIIWGGSTSVGCNAIQLAVASGFQVIATSSPRNFDLCKSLGASYTFDYNSKTVVSDMVAAIGDKVLHGAITIGNGGAEACYAVMSNVNCDKKFVSMVSYPLPSAPPERFEVLQTIVYFVSWNTRWWAKTKVGGVRSKFVFGSSMAFNDISKALFERYLPDALAKGRFVAAPESQVVGHGLEQIQDAFDAQKSVSAKKIVVTL